MNNDQIEGGVKQAIGRVTDAAGALTDDARTQINGKLRQAAGKTQSLYGDARDTVESAVIDRPITALAAAAGLGFIAGTLLAKRPV